MRIKIYFLYAILYHLSVVVLSADTRLTAETSALGGLPGLISMHFYEKGRLPESWEEIATLRPELHDRLLTPVRQGKNLTELYSFISSDDRARFPYGELILVRHVPLANPSHRIGGNERWFVGRTPQGGIGVTAWNEERFQAMLTETGITIPPPQPLPPEPPLPAENQQQLEPQLQSEDSKSESAAEQSAIPDDADFPAPPENQPAQPDSEQQAEETENRTLLWLAGTLLALLLIAAVLRARKRDGSQ